MNCASVVFALLHGFSWLCHELSPCSRVEEFRSEVRTKLLVPKPWKFNKSAVETKRVEEKKKVTVVHFREACWDPDSLEGLASSLVWAHNSRSGGHEFKPRQGQNLASGRSGIRSSTTCLICFFHLRGVKITKTPVRLSLTLNNGISTLAHVQNREYTHPPRYPPFQFQLHSADTDTERYTNWVLWTSSICFHILFPGATSLVVLSRCSQTSDPSTSALAQVAPLPYSLISEFKKDSSQSFWPEKEKSTFYLRDHFHNLSTSSGSNLKFKLYNTWN